VSSREKTSAARPSAPDLFHAFLLYQRLRDRYGPSGWWPGETRLEIAVGAVLTQNTAWSNVEKAIALLKEHSMLDVRRIHSAPADTLAALIRPSGYYNLKSVRLKNLMQVIMELCAGDVEAFFNRDLQDLRSVLLAVNGIGKETADSICCYAADKAIFVVDAYTRRILSRHGMVEEQADYEAIRHLFESGLPRDPAVYKDLHAYLVSVGKDFCLKSRPRCESCPLKGWP
jgi:endonuclease-3 related protein